MNKELFKKLFRIIIRASMVTVLTIVLFCSIIIKGYFLKIKLDDIQDKVRHTISNYEKDDNLLFKNIQRRLGNDLLIRVYDSQEKATYKFNNFKYENSYISDEKISKVLDPYIETVLGGNSIKDVTKLYGIKGECMLIGEPINEDNDVVRAIFIIKSTSYFTNWLIVFYIVLIISMTLVLISIIVPIYIFIKREFKPIEDMTDATILMSNGDFSIRVEANQNNVIGELVRKFNYLADNLQKNEEESKMLDQMRKDYVANVSHELKTPVTSIRAIAEMLNDDELKDSIDKNKYYSMILRESIRLEVLIKDMLELSRLQSGNIAFEKSYVSVNDIINEVIEKFEIMADDLDIDFITPKNLDNIPSIYTNYNRIVQILIILLDNAFKFTASGGVVCLEVSSETEYLEISIIDSGIGIDKEDIPFIFDRFYKADKYRNSNGTGIGLSIAYEIIKHLNENIYVESEIGRGSKFTFTIHYM
ncbi:sensor histidine kinase [Romboutsia ilealis]|uniref:sensor histidine kinase n=1 Tax=Romboutsia ilealis TaxID=1115758 RepID=UPI002675D82A|nr:HAMP domain-containing sensor histidine kinase [Romboutsia ilealis]